MNCEVRPHVRGSNHVVPNDCVDDHGGDHHRVGCVNVDDVEDDVYDDDGDDDDDDEDDYDDD